ncbi:MAG TPA: HNH endonuclease signature motif containing protein, partial [Jatrophihabitantaceae bacterium]
CQAVLDGQSLDVMTGGATPKGRKGRKGRRSRIQVTVALSTLLGLDQQPAELAGYGPIPASVARKLAGDPNSTWHRLVHDEVGDLIDYGRAVYQPPQDLVDFVTARDHTCRGPGCNRDSRSCELDHVRDWANGGATSHDNLGPECGRHHHLKHDCGWNVERNPDGTYTWTSPTGQTYDKPPDELPKDTTLETQLGDDPPPF